MFTGIPFENGWSSCREHQTLCSKHERTSNPADRIVIPACCCRGLYRRPFKIYIRINPIDTSRIQCIQRITLINPFLPYVFSNLLPIATFLLWQNFVIQPFGDRYGFQRLLPPAFRAAANPNLFFDQWTAPERYGLAAAKLNRKPPDRLPQDPTIQ